MTDRKQGGELTMAIKKSELYTSLWKSCDELRGGIIRDARNVPPDTRFCDRHLAECRRVETLRGLRG